MARTLVMSTFPLLKGSWSDERPASRWRGETRDANSNTVIKASFIKQNLDLTISWLVVVVSDIFVDSLKLELMGYRLIVAMLIGTFFVVPAFI
jgi:hypothetical protein